MLLLFEKHFVKKILYKNKLSFRYQLIGFYHNRHDKNLEAEQVIYTKLNREQTSLLFNFEQSFSIDIVFIFAQRALYSFIELNK